MGSDLQYEAFEAGGGGLKLEQSMVLHEVSCTWQESDALLEINVPDSAGYIEGSVKVLGFPDSWKRYKELSLEASNPNGHSVSIALTIFGPRNIISDTFNIAEKSRQIIGISLLDLPLTAGNRELYIPNKLRIAVEASQADYGLRVKDLRLTSRLDSTDLACVDEFGQRIRGTWDHKITEEAQLVAARRDEETTLSQMSKNEQWGKFFGLNSGEDFAATGFFRVEKTSRNGDEKWWFITPDGKPFWSLGVTCIRPSNYRTAVTKVRGREFLFEKLPLPEGKHSSAYLSDSTISIFRLNLLKKYGTLDAWRIRALERVEKWGLNSIGNWTEDSVIFKRRLPYTYSFRTNEKPGLRMGNGLCYVFSQEWIRYVDEVLSVAADLKEDRLLIGYFVDNEAGWGNPELLNIAPDGSTLREKWVALLKQRYSDLKALNVAWGSDLQSWAEVRSLDNKPQPKHVAFQSDYRMLEEAFAEQYFRVITETLRKYDPNHLYLGCRFTRKLKPDHILKVAGRYCDVVTVNVYSRVPIRSQMEAWYQKTGRPILIGEHHLPLLSERQLPPRYRAFTAEERYQYYIEYVKTFAEMPFSLGCHWYQFSDQHLTGRMSNGENQIIGLVDITDQPHEEMVRAIGVCSKNIYQWHSSASD